MCRGIEGIKTILPFHRVVLEDEVFSAGRHTTDFVEKQNIIGKVRQRTKNSQG